MTQPIIDPELVTAARTELWRRGELGYKLHAGQRELRDRYYANRDKRKNVWNCARRYGKSTLLCLLALEHCYRVLGARVVFAAPTRDQVRDIVEPIMRQLLEDCPNELRPQWREQRHQFIFPNGAELHLDGADDDRGNHLRGPRATLVLCDEVGFWRHASYVINSILLPQTITCDGRVVIASTPPESVAHEFWALASEAISRDAYAKRTIYDNPMITAELRAEYARESGGEQSTAWRREYLCDAVTESARAVIPEFDAEKHVIDSYELPQFADLYCGLDLGLVDLTHCVFGHYNFNDATLIIEDEVCVNYTRTKDVADLINAKERERWGERRVTGRYSDNEAQQLYDLHHYGASFAPALKIEKEAALNRLRLLFAQGKIKIHRRCKNLIHQLSVGIWNERRTDYERLPGAGHLDGLDALVYLSRSINYNRNPVPATYGVSRSTHHIPQNYGKKSNELTKLVRR